MANETMYDFKFTLKHDGGIHYITIAHTDIRLAINMILEAESAPLRSIRNIQIIAHDEKPTWENVKKLLPETTSLTYVDYRESFDERHKEIQQCIRDNHYEALYDLVHEWFVDQEANSIDEIKKELKSDIERQFGLTEDEAEDVIEEFDDEIRDECHERRDDTPMQDLLNNTSDLIGFYDTGYEMESDSWNWDDDRIDQEREAIKEFLGITADSYNESLDMMIAQATYGGNLHIYFKVKPDMFICQDREKFKSIKFTGAQIGIVDHGNGSGDVLDREISEEIILPLNFENIFLEKNIKYNWTYSIAGMCRDWADSTEVELSEQEIEGEVKSSSDNALIEQEDKYNKTYQAGGCTFGDMDIRRHRNKEYVNDFPCGTRCHDCGTFWID